MSRQSNGIDFNGEILEIIPPSPTEEIRGGIKAELKDSNYTVELKLGEDGKLYAPSYPTVTGDGEIDIPVWAQQPNKPTYTASEVGADAKGTASSAISVHNTASDSHSDIRLLITELTTRINTVLNSEDVDLDQLAELVAYIKANRSLIEQVTTNKINVSDIIDNLTTNVANKPLSAKQGVVLKTLIDAIKVPTALSELSADATHRLVTDTEKAIWNAKSNFSGSYNDLSNKPTIPSKTSQLTNDSGYITKVPVEVVVQNGMPNEGNIWIDTDASEEMLIAEIDDDTIDPEKTWSSSKINEKMVQVDQNKTDISKLGGTVEITSDNPSKANTVMTIDPSAEEVNVYSAEEVDAITDELNEKIVQEVNYIEHNTLKKYTLDVSTIKTLSQTIGDGNNNLCLIATRSIQSDNKMPDYTGYLYYDKLTNKIYYSSITPDNPVYLCDWDSSLSNGESAMLWMASITVDGDIIFLKYKERRNPIIYPHGGYDSPYVVDFGSNIAPYGYLMASSIVQFEDGTFVFGDYASHSLSDEETKNPRNIWRVIKPYNDITNWNVAHSFKHVHNSSNQSNEPDNEIGHIHAISYDWYSGVTYCNTGDIDRHCRIWKSLDKGITWSAIDGAVGTNINPNIFGDGQKWRMASFVFTEDYCYWGTDSFYDKHVLYRCSRNEDNIIDFSTIEKVCSLEKNPSSECTQATYGHILLRNPNGILFLDRGEPRPDGLLDVTFYSFDDEELHICKTFKRATTDIGNEQYEVANRIGLPNQCGTYYQPQCTDYVMIGGAYIRANNTSLFDNSTVNYVGALKFKVNEIGIVQVSHPKNVKIVKQPDNAYGKVGDIVEFNVVATGDGLRYQWQTSTDGGSQWYNTSIQGNKTNTLTVELNTSRMAYLYRCIVSDIYGNSVESSVTNVIEVETPDAETLEITKQPVNAQCEIGDTVTFSIEATGKELNYQWYASVPSDDNNNGYTSYVWYESQLDGNKTNTLTVELTETRMQYLYKCVVTDSEGNSIESDTVFVPIPLEITQQPSDVHGDIGDTVKFNVKVNGFRLSYQWQTSTNNGVQWINTSISGEKTNTLTVELNASRITYLYKCIVTDYYGNTIESDVAKVI